DTPIQAPGGPVPAAPGGSAGHRAVTGAGGPTAGPRTVVRSGSSAGSRTVREPGGAARRGAVEGPGGSAAGRPGGGGPGVLAVLAEIGYPLVHGTARAAVTVAAVVVFCAASAGHAVATRGWRVGAALLGVFAVGGWLVDAVGVRTGVPFGRYSYGERLGPALSGVPVVVGLARCMAAWPADVAALRLAGGRPGGADPGAGAAAVE